VDPGCSTRMRTPGTHAVSASEIDDLIDRIRLGRSPARPDPVGYRIRRELSPAGRTRTSNPPSIHAARNLAARCSAGPGSNVMPHILTQPGTSVTPPRRAGEIHQRVGRAGGLPCRVRGSHPKYRIWPTARKGDSPCRRSLRHSYGVVGSTMIKMARRDRASTAPAGSS
jgi:hypothetical protein